MDGMSSKRRQNDPRRIFYRNLWKAEQLDRDLSRGTLLDERPPAYVPLCGLKLEATPPEFEAAGRARGLRK
jgi:hypothetical protein